MYASEPEARAKYDHIDFTPPAGAREEAARGLAWRSEFGRGGTPVGIARARDLSNGVRISPSTARRMKAFFDRHQSDRNADGWRPGEDGFPSNGRIAHALWGGDAGYSWSKKLVRQMNAADERSEIMSSMIECRALCVDDFSEEDQILCVETRDAEAGKQDWIIGYAARFGVESLKMDDFYERIDPAAFSIVRERRGRKTPLETRALFNHDPNYVLGRYPNTLHMSVDDKGLRYEVLMPESRKDITEAIRRGDIRGSSFSFIVPPGGDEWSIEEGRSIRTVKSIASLIDVGPVTFPAYPDASVSVAKRSYQMFVAKQSAKDFAVSQKMDDIRKFLKERGR